MKVSKQSRRDAKALFQACRANGTLDENLVRSTVEQMLQLKPRGYFGILTHFQRLVKLDLDRRRASVETALALTPEQETSLKEHLCQRYGDGLSFIFHTNAELIGGMRVKVGSDVFDGTVQGRLKELEESFKAA